jgi:hypothetical protein
MSGITFLGWLAIAYTGSFALPGSQLDHYNTKFAYKVDNRDSCFTRIGGEEGSYGHSSDFSLDLMCNYKLKHETVNKDVKVWKLIRD